MLRKFFPPVLALVCISVIVANPQAALAGGSCGSYESQTTGCPTVGGSVHGGGVDVVGSVTSPGSSGLQGNANAGAGSGTGKGTGGRGGAFVTKPPPPPPPARDGYSVTTPGAPPGISPVTVNDLVNFRPVAGIDQMEPKGWMVVGLDTNFYASVGGGVQTGLLLDQPASVRFSALRYRWSYGDGSSVTRANHGASWAAQGLAEFDATPTSHVYSTAGTYSIDLTIEFSAEYQFAGAGWIPVAGTVPVAANRLTATAGNAQTVLVDRNCTQNPSGPGC